MTLQFNPQLSLDSAPLAPIVTVSTTSEDGTSNPVNELDAPQPLISNTGSVTIPGLPDRGGADVITLKTSPVDYPTPVIFKAMASDGSIAYAVLTVMPPAISKIVVSNATGTTANEVSGIVQLTGPAAKDISVTLHSIGPVKIGNAETDENGNTTVLVRKGSDVSEPFTLTNATQLTSISSVISASMPPTGIFATVTQPFLVNPSAITKYRIAKGTIVFVTTSAGFSSETARRGDKIGFTVAADVYGEVNDDPTSRAVVIPKGSPVLCEVIHACHSRTLLRHGALSVAIEQVEAVDFKMLDVGWVSDDPQTVYERASYGAEQQPADLLSENMNGPDFKAFTAGTDGSSNFNDAVIQEARTYSSTAEMVPSGIPSSKGVLVGSAGRDDQAGKKVVFGRADTSLVLSTLFTGGAEYGLSTVDEKSANGDLLAVQGLITGPTSFFNNLFIGIPATLPSGSTFAVQTTDDYVVAVKNPLAGQ